MKREVFANRAPTLYYTIVADTISSCVDLEATSSSEVTTAMSKGESLHDPQGFLCSPADSCAMSEEDEAPSPSQLLKLAVREEEEEEEVEDPTWEMGKRRTKPKTRRRHRRGAKR